MSSQNSFDLHTAMHDLVMVDKHKTLMMRAIIFDFGQVICSFDVNIFLRRIAQRNGKSFAEITQLMPQLSAAAIRYETGLVTSDQFYQQVSTICDLSIPPGEFIKAYCDIFTPIPSTFALVRDLKPRYKLGLLSNTSEWHFEFGIKPVSIFPLFDTVTLSFEVGAMKPSKEIYLDAIRKLNIPPACCVYIDDLKENADAAAELGLHGIQYTSPEKLKESLRSLGVVVD